MGGKAGNPQNLKPIHTTEEAQRRGSLGGKASVISKKKKKAAREAARTILNLTASPDKQKELEAMGIDDPNDFTNRMVVFAKAYLKAQAGNVKAMEFIMEMSGESPQHMLDEKKFKAQQKTQASSSNLVDEWIDSIPDFVPAEKKE